MVSFTGFKFTRENRVSIKPFRSEHFLRITHCTQGNADFSSTVSLQQHSINETFCVFPQFSQVLRDRSNFGKVNRFAVRIANRVLGKKPQKAQLSIEEATKNMTCYKMSRRLQFAKSNTLFFIPYTFVGVLYECNITSTQKASYLNDYPFAKSPNCDDAIPVKPIVAEDASKSFFDWTSSPLSIFQTIPYLKTASPLDPRFTSKTNIWAKDIRLNEDYQFTEIQMQRFSVASSKVANHIRKITKAPLTSLERWFSRKKDQSKLDNEAKFAYFLSQQNASTTMRHLKTIQSLWLLT